MNLLTLVAPVDKVIVMSWDVILKAFIDKLTTYSHAIVKMIVGLAVYVMLLDIFVTNSSLNFPQIDCHLSFSLVC